MSKNPVKPRSSYNDKGTKGGCYASTPVVGQMKLGAASNLSSRSGTFKGTADDIRRAGTFRSFPRVGDAGGQKGQGHTSQPKGHKSKVTGMKG